MKKKLTKIIAMCALAGLMACSVGGCGKTEIDVMDGLTLEFNGVDGQGTARIADEYFWEDAAFEAAGIDGDSEDLSLLGRVMTIEEAVSYKISPRENLSNGDEVTVTSVVDNESVEDYKIKFAAGEKKYTVEGLKEIEQADLFENVEVEFTGIAPDVKASVRYGNSAPVFVTYSLDRDQALTVGDTVTVTAEYDADQLLEKGYVAEGDTKEFVVPECDRYVSELSQIPSDIMEKMKHQIEDAIQAKDWDTVTEVKFIGNYFLSLKPGMDSSDHNAVYVLYRIEDVDMEYPDGDQKLYFYTYGKFEDLLLLKDGTCSVDLSRYEMLEGSAFTKSISSGDLFWRGDYYYVGFEDLDTMFNKCVTKNVENYEYETNVTEE